MAEPQGNPPPQGGQGTDPPEGSDQQQPKYVTQEQLNEIVNRAITGRFADFEKRQKNSLTQILAERDTKLATSITESLAEKFGSALDEKLAALKPKDDEQKPKPADAPPAPKLEDTPAYKAMAKKLELLEKANAEGEQRRLQAEQQRRNVELRSSLTTELSKHGIAGDRAAFALGHLVDAAKLVYHRPESDEIVFKNGDEELPLGDGLKTWVASDQGKFFLPPKEIRGSGDGPSGGTGGNNRNNSTGLGDLLLTHFRQGI